MKSGEAQPRRGSVGLSQVRQALPHWCCGRTTQIDKSRIQRQELNIAIRALNRRFNYSTNVQAQRLGRRIDLSYHALMLFRISYNPALADFTFAYFKLRLDENDDATLLVQQRHKGRQNLRRRDEGNIDRDEIKLRLKIGRRQMPS